MGIFVGYFFGASPKTPKPMAPPGALAEAAGMGKGEGWRGR